MKKRSKWKDIRRYKFYANLMKSLTKEEIKQGWRLTILSTALRLNDPEYYKA